jgi:hypothetical protein
MAGGPTLTGEGADVGVPCCLPNVLSCQKAGWLPGIGLRQRLGVATFRRDGSQTVAGSNPTSGKGFAAAPGAPGRLLDWILLLPSAFPGWRQPHGAMLTFEREALATSVRRNVVDIDNQQVR